MSESTGTRFPDAVVDPRKSPRLFVSGHTEPKLGAAMKIGRQKGWPIFHLSLEERATCPRSCPVWEDCCGNMKEHVRRHIAGDALEAMIPEELELLSRDYPSGFIVRLHTLGDFYSRPYVDLWRAMLAQFPGLHVFGTTAWTPETPIGRQIHRLAAKNWDRFAIRVLGAEPHPEGVLVVDADPIAPNVVLCPAQTGGAVSCASCGICWAQSYRGRAVAFLRHGTRFDRRSRAGSPSLAPPAPIRAVASDSETPITPALLRLARAGDKIAIAAVIRKGGKVE